MKVRENGERAVEAACITSLGYMLPRLRLRPGLNSKRCFRQYEISENIPSSWNILSIHKGLIRRFILQATRLHSVAEHVY